MSDDKTLQPGYYLGIRRQIRDFSFDLPKVSEGPAFSSFDEMFSQLNSGNKKKATPQGAGSTSFRAGVEKSTSFSGWNPVSGKAQNVSKKARLADQIYSQAGGDDTKQAAEAVRRFKKGAANVLSRCADTGETITEATAAEINQNACTVHELRVVMLHVSATDLGGYRFDKNTNLFYREKTLRKFYVSSAPTDGLLTSFAEEVADGNTTVDASMRLVAVRRDNPKTRAAGERASNFRIETVPEEEAWNIDAQLMAAITRIKSKAAQSRGSGA